MLEQGVLGLPHAWYHFLEFRQKVRIPFLHLIATIAVAVYQIILIQTAIIAYKLAARTLHSLLSKWYEYIF